jgi:hypothetical protein
MVLVEAHGDEVVTSFATAVKEEDGQGNKMMLAR